MRAPGWLRAAIVFSLLGLIAACRARELHAQTSGKPAKAEAQTCAVRDVHSRHFLIHTDFSQPEADDVVQRLEALLRHISAYWREPMRGVVECNIIRHPDKFPAAGIAPKGVRAIKTCGGMTLVYLHREGRRPVFKSVVYANARLEVIQHELVHAYCYQTFGRSGPVWYSEGMAEMAHYWREGDAAVHADSREIEFLHNHPPKSLAAVLSPAQVTGDCWQNYASRWALCHFMVSNPNYSQQFRQLGHALLAGKEVSFEQTYASTTRELFFEYLFFLQHISPGYRVDLCAWNWKKKFADLQPGGIQTVAIAAGRGWQPTGLTVRAGTHYEYLASGAWQIAGQPEAIDADGDDQHRGRLVGVLMKDRHLGDEFELGAKGSLQLDADGDLYLRCRRAWNALADDHGNVTVKFQLHGHGSPPPKADGKGPVRPLTTCPTASGARQ
jgi:hypothetical protein